MSNRPSDFYTAREQIKRLIAKADAAVAVWNKYYPSLPRSAEDDEFGAFLNLRGELASAKSTLAMLETE